MDAANTGRRTDLNGGGGGRRDYGAKGCAGIVYGALVAAAVSMAILAKAVAR